MADPRDGVELIQVLEQGYHLSIHDQDDLPDPSRAAYLGPGSSARFLEHLLKSALHWHLANNVHIPKRLLPENPSQLIEPQHVRALPSFLILHDQRKVDLQSVVPPSTQRAIIEHYLKIVSPEYTLLPTEQESALLVHENPLRWSSSNKENPIASAISIVFAISSALVTRDVDPNLSSISTRYAEDVYKITQRTTSPANQVEATRWLCTALCALALYESINPTSGQLWDLLSRAASTLEDLRESYRLIDMGLDSDFQRLERSFLKLER